jgi:predicted Zn-dependent protease
VAPRRPELLDLAERALEGARGEAQATAWWERQLSVTAGGAVTTEAVSVEVAVLRDGRVGTAVTTDVDRDGLRRALEAAGRMASTGPEAAGPLPEPSPGRPHDGYDPAAVHDELPAVGAWSSRRAAAARTAIASTRGVRAYEERSFGDLRVRRHDEAGRSLELSLTAVRPADLDAATLEAEAAALLGFGGSAEAAALLGAGGSAEAAALLGAGGSAEAGLVGAGQPVAIEAGEYPAVLGPWAVAEVLRRVALSFGGPWSPLADRLGTPVAAPAVNLSDSPRFAATLPRTYDAEGAPRQPMPLIQDGVAHRLAGPGTGHAQGPGGVGGSLPEHLVLVGGAAADLPELAAPIRRGLFIPALSLHGAWLVGRRGAALAEGVRLIRDGEPAEPVPNLTVTFEPLELLGQVQALSARQRTIPPPVQLSARTASATVAPAARIAGRLFVAGPA